MELGVERLERRRIGRPHVDLHPALVRYSVDGRAAADTSHVEGRSGLERDLEGVDLGDRASHRLNRVGHAESAVTVAAGSFESDLIAVAADADVSDTQAGSVDGDELVDAALQRLVKELLHTAEVAETLLADVGDKGDRAGRLHAGLR